MSRRRWILLIGAVALLAAGLEVVAWIYHGSRGVVEVVNDGDTTLQDLVISFGETRTAVGDLRAGQSARVWLEGDRKGAVTLAFTQKLNPLTGFLLDDVDPGQLYAEQLKMVVHVRPNEVTRSVEDAEDDPGPLARLKRRIVDRISAEFSLH